MSQAPRISFLWALAGPPSLWALHFIAVYAGISASCAARSLLSPTTVALGIGALTLLGVAVSLVTAFRPPEPLSDEIRRAARFIAAISAAAILFNALPFLFSTSCGG